MSFSFYETAKVAGHMHSFVPLTFSTVSWGWLGQCTVSAEMLSMWRLKWHFTRQSPLQGHLTISKLELGH